MKNCGKVYLLLLFSCGKGNEERTTTDDFVARMSDKAYLGSAKSTLYLHGYEAFPSVPGKGSFSLSSVLGDSVTLALICELTSGDGFSFGMPGKQSDIAWSAKFDSGSFAIQENGIMSGSIQAGDQEVSWDGQLFTDRIMLDVKLKYLKQQGSITAGSIVVTHLDLSHSRGDANEDANGCRTIVWENRSVFNIYNGGVDIMRVPVCHD